MTFRNPDEVYATLGAFLEELAASPGLGAEIAALGQTVEINLTDPAATIVLQPAGTVCRTVFGSEDPSATAVMNMPAETAHSLFLARTTFASAIDRRELVISTEAADLRSVLPLVAFAGFPRYQERLEAIGREDLL